MTPVTSFTCVWPSTSSSAKRLPTQPLQTTVQGLSPGLQQVNHPWNLNTSPSVCSIFKHTIPHQKKTSVQQKLALPMFFHPLHDKDDTVNSASVPTLTKPSLSLSKTTAPLSAHEWPSRPSKLPFTSSSSVTSTISSSIKRPSTPPAEKSTSLKSHNMPLLPVEPVTPLLPIEPVTPPPPMRPVTPPFPMRPVTSSPPELSSMPLSKQPHSSPKRFIRPSTSSSAKRLHTQPLQTAMQEMDPSLEPANYPRNFNTSPSVCSIFKHTTISEKTKPPTKAGNSNALSYSP